MRRLRAIQYRQFFLIFWLLCYALIVLFYLLAVRDDGTITFMDIKPLLFKTSGVILPQLTIMIGFFYAKTKAQVERIVQKTTFSKLAYIMSIFYITIFTILVFLGISLKILPGNTLTEINNMILIVMGVLSIFSNGPIVYLFGKRNTQQNQSPSPEG